MPNKIRLDDDLPQAITDWGWKYHHMGIPTTNVMPNETYLPEYKLYVSGYSTSPFGIEWMRYQKDSPINKIIQNVPHIAFKVENIDYELHKQDFKIITPPNSPSVGCRVALIEHNGAIIELIEFKKNASG